MNPDDSPPSYCVTGVCGSIGAALFRYLLSARDDPDLRLVGIDHDENGVFRLEERFAGDPRVRIVVGDVRDRDALSGLFRGVHTVFHTAALKHVYQCEKAPLEAIRTNVLGVAAVLEAARSSGVARVVVTSTDKAVNPTSVMGTSKLMAERLVTAVHSGPAGVGPVCVSTRFGNVLGSNGSVLEVFRRQIRAGEDLTLTDERMTRFVMDTEEALRLVVETASLARGGEVFVPKMPALRIADLAHAAVRRWAPASGRRSEDVAVRCIGPRPGEKLYEELMTEEEARRAVELEDRFVVLPAFRPVYRGIDYRYPGQRPLSAPSGYRSDNVPLLDREAIEALLDRLEASATPEGGPCA